MARKTAEKMEIEQRLPKADASDVSDASDTSDAAGGHSDASLKKNKRKAAAGLPELEIDLNLPEPPSKRAKRALKKGKTLPAKPNPLADMDDKDEDDDKAKNNGKAERSQFGIWIGNLAFTVTRPQLFRWFIDCSGGAIAEADITRVNLPMVPVKAPFGRPQRPPPQAHAAADSASSPAAAATPKMQNKGFAYVDFATYEAQVAATALSETELEGRRVLIKDSKSFEGRPKPASQAGVASAGGGGEGGGAGAGGDDPPGRARGAAASNVSGYTKIFVGNLGFETTEDDLRHHFAPCGPIAWAKVATFPDNTEKCRGYGWVQFGGEVPDESATTKTAATPAEAAAAAVQGFVRIKETIDTEEDFAAEAADGADGAEDTDGEDTDKVQAKSKEPRTKTRKWWVNMLKGRTLKVQFAEDDQTRYRKRFGKDRPQKQQQQQQRRPRQDKWQGAEKTQQDQATAGVDKPFKYQDLSIAQRTGAVTVSLGKKTVLE